MQKKANWDSKKKTVDEISDQHVQPRDKRKEAQKRTFTRWMNVFLQRCDPPLEVHDLFTDIQDGRILMALLEELSGCKLLYRFRSASHRIFRLNNISKALAFLDDRHVKLLGIDASSIADGIPSVVLNLVWNIILYFQVKEVTGGLQRHLSCSLSSLSMNSYPSSGDLSPQLNDIGSYSCFTLPSKGRKTARESKYHGKAIKTLLQWVQRITSKFGVEVHDFGKSWRSGLAFLAMIKSINPDLVDLRESLSRNPRENIEQAFMIAHQSLDIPPLLEPEDVTCTSPDEQSIITYVSMFLGQCPGINEDYTADIEAPETQNFGSLDSVSFGRTFAYDPHAQALPKGLEKSSEQPLWKHWSKTSSGSSCDISFQMNGAGACDLFYSNDDVFSPCRSIPEQSAGSAAISPFYRKKGRMLDSGAASRESQLWIDQGYNRQKVDDFSLSSEEGISSLSALDSDEEDAYSYILDLNKEIFLPHNHLKRQVLRVEEETAEEISEESKHPEACEMLNDSGFKYQQDSLVPSTDTDLDSEVRAHSLVHRKFVLDKKESSFRDMKNTRAIFDMEPDDESSGKEQPEEEKVVRGQGHGDYGEEEKTEHVRVVTHGYDETEARVDEAEKTKMLNMASWQKEYEEDSNKGLSLKCLQVNEIVDNEEEMYLTSDEGKNRNLDQKEEEDNGKEEDRENWQSVHLDSFDVRVNETIDESVFEVRCTSGTKMNIQEDQDKAHNMETLTKTSKDENMEEHTSEVKNSADFESITVEKKDIKLKTKKCKFSDKKATTVNDPAQTTTKNDTRAGVDIHNGDSSWISAYSATSHSVSAEGGLLFQSLTAFCDITPLELEMLFVLWILLYCCLILPQMNL